jgi:single-stranded-DNA-specific exonuclease
VKHRWQLAPSEPDAVLRLCREFGISRLLAQCLVNREQIGSEAVARFLQPRLKHLADPLLLPDMGIAVDRLVEARERNEALVIFGDYDVDGVTSTTILLDTLRGLGWQAGAYLPHRVDEGYGLSRDGVENCLAAHPVSLLLAVDCGSTSVDTIGVLRDRGVDVIVLDHHQVSDPAPPAAALVNPQRGERFHELCSAGLAFKLAHALVKHGRACGWPEADAFDVRDLLDLAALGTIADIVPLKDENRILVSAGLPRLTNTRRPGLMALKEVAGCSDEIGVYEVGFQLGPRLNAAGRLETATEALDLLTTTEAGTAMRLATDLDTRNRERQSIERHIADTVIQRIRERFDPSRDFALVEGDTDWHIGVVGIVASRVVREFYRPSFIIGGEGQIWRGSGRGVAGFDLAAALRECDDLLDRHGGHAMAAGLALAPERLDAFRVRLNEIVRRDLDEESLKPPLRLDAAVTLEELDLPALTELERLQPTGQGNPSVQVMVPRLTLRSRPRVIGKERNHLLLTFTDGRSEMEAVWWNGADQPLPEGACDLACVPEVNSFRGRNTPRLKVLDWRPSR